MTQNLQQNIENNYILPFTIDNLDIRGRIITLDSTITKILNRHNYPETVSHLLAQMLCATALIGSSLKFQGKLSLQTSSQGPVNLLVCDFITPNKIRAYARFDKNALQEKILRKETNFTNLVGKGHLAFTIQKENVKQIYQGIVSLEGDNLDQVIENYFLQSEQIETKIKLTNAKIINDKTEKIHFRAGGILMQYIPTKEKNKDNFLEACAFFNTIDPFELIDPQIDSERLLFRLFHEYKTRIYEKIPIFEYCSCSLEKIENLLSSFSEDELNQSTEDGKISVSCQFCSQTYSFLLKNLRKKC